MRTRSPRASGTNRFRRALVAVTALVGLVGATGCILPNAPAYPYYGPFGSRQGVIDAATNKSKALEQYVKDFLDGKVPADIPAGLVADSTKGIKNWKVQRESEIDPSKQWGFRDATPTIDWSSASGLYPEPAGTYFVNLWMAAPFGSKVIITGQFPHSRFFDIEVSESFQPELYHGTGFGVGEVPIVDADINPDPGSTNPFRVGANRNATNRNYTVTLESRIGNATQLTNAYKPSTDFRAQNNVRPTSGIRYSGPWGDPNYVDFSPLVTKTGPFSAGQIWIRYYQIDSAVGPRGGVPTPKITYQLPDGRKYFILPDFSELEALMNKRSAIRSEPADDPRTNCGPTVGWRKQWGLVRNAAEIATKTLGGSIDKPYVRNLEKGIDAKAEDLPPPSNYESTASLVPYNHYLNRCMSVQPGKVAVLTGRKPTTPKTRAGQAVMTGAQAKFWSITTYDDWFDLFNPQGRAFGMPITSVTDEDVVTDANGYYTIVYSSPADRPANATAANGVTWVNWGPKGNSAFMLRWQCVGPEWTFAKCPDEMKLGRRSDQSSVQFDPNVLGRNDNTGFLGDYQPITHYLGKAEFEALGTNVRWNQIPVWR